MNIVAKTLTHKIFIDKVINFSFPKIKLWVFILFSLILFMALGVIYMKDLNRRLLINYQELKMDNSALNVAHSKLLLEYSMLSAQARIQKIAIKNLNMQMPSLDRIKTVKL